MASPAYNNKTLAASEAKRKLGVSFEQAPEAGNDGYMQDPSADDILADAKKELQNLNNFSEENNFPRLAALPDSLAALQATTDKRGGYRKFTEGLGTVGQGLGAAALPTAFVGAAPLAASLGTASSAAMVPDYLRRMINPESDESTPGLVESAVTVAPAALSSLKYLRGAAKPAISAAEELAGANLPESWAKLSQGRKEVPYRMFPSKPLAQDVSQMEMTGGRLKNTPVMGSAERLDTAHMPSSYSAELGRAMRSEPTPNAASTFDRMSSEGAFGPEQAAFTRKNPRGTSAKTSAKPTVKGRDITKLGGPSLQSLRNAIISKEALAKALAEFQP